MKTISILVCLIWCCRFSAQTPQDLNAQLRKEHAEIKAEYEQVKQKIDPIKQRIETLCLQVDSITISAGRQKLSADMSKLYHYYDTLSCAEMPIEKIMPYKSLMIDQNVAFPNEQISALKMTKSSFGSYTSKIELGKESVEIENEQLKREIEKYLFCIEINKEGYINSKEILAKQISFLKDLREDAKDFVDLQKRVTFYNQKVQDTLLLMREKCIKFPQEQLKYRECFFREKPKSVSPPPEPVIFDVVSEVAEYPGGREAMEKFLKENIVLPENVLNGNVSGKVYLKFVVSETGNISNVKVVRGVIDCKECDTEAVRVVKAMPDWLPGKQNGRPVNMWYSLPIIFKEP